MLLLYCHAKGVHRYKAKAGQQCWSSDLIINTMDVPASCFLIIQLFFYYSLIYTYHDKTLVVYGNAAEFEGSVQSGIW